MGQVVRLAAAELQRDRVFFFMKAQVARHVAVDQRAGGHHLRVEQCVARHEAMENAAMAISPFHHGCNRQPAAPSF
ncbi:hypothetical protein D3C71_1511990 [compost metagenome]